MDEVTAAGLNTDSFDQSTSTLEQAGLDRDAFLRIFMTQLRFQDPLNPQESSELSAQLATFSQLEQSIVQVDELRAIRSGLDELVQASKVPQTPPAIDPVSLIGKDIEVATDEILVPESGDSIELGFDIERAGIRALSFLARAPSGDIFGLASISAHDVDPDAGEAASFAPGHYTLVFADGVPQLRGPDGDLNALEFLPLIELPNGELGADPDGTPQGFVGGTTYAFETEGRNSSDQRTPFAMTTWGTVSAVRVHEGLPVLVIGGQDVDPTKIVQIQ